MKTLLDEEKVWVEEENAWLKASYAGPLPADPWMIADQTGSLGPTKYPSVEQVLDDLCRILDVERTLVSHEYLGHLPNRQPPPSRLIAHQGSEGLQLFVLGFAASALTHVIQVLKQSILWMVDIRLRLSNVMLPESGEARRQWAELAAIFFGFGPIMAQRRMETVRMASGRWTITTTYRSSLPSAVFAYALIVHQEHRVIDGSTFLKPLPSEVRYDVKQAMADRSTGADRSKEKPKNAVHAQSQVHLNKFELALRRWQEVLIQAKTNKDKALAEHNIGYYYSCLGQFSLAVDHLQRSLQLNADQVYAHENLSFAFTMIGRLDDAERSLRKSEAGKQKRNASYVHRDWAVLYWMRGDQLLAEKHFKEAFDQTGQVDLLFALYARFLEWKGDRKQAALYAQQAFNEFQGELPEWIRTIGPNHG